MFKTVPLTNPLMSPYSTFNNKADQTTREPANVLRRRPDPQQGRALELLGHAIEYLVDSQLAATQGSTAEADAHAVRILSYRSKKIFLECAETIPMHLQLKQWLREQLNFLFVIQPPRLAAGIYRIAGGPGFRFQTRRMKMVFRTAAFCMLTLDTFAFALERVSINPVRNPTKQVIAPKKLAH